MNRLWILGAADPEMERIERLLRESGEQFVHATVNGRRVTPASAYRADTPGLVPLVAGWGTIIAVECAWTHLDGESGSVVVVDHHRPGDPGYGAPPEEFWRGSSLGQVLALLGRDPSPDDLMIAAADHCLAAAYRGECPGVDPDDLMRWRAESRAAFQKRAVSAVMADIDAARGALRGAPSLDLGGIVVRDLRGRTVPELPEAAVREGICFVSTLRARDGRVQVVCQAGTPEQIKAFMEIWAPNVGVEDIYGDPARGFAGGYLE